MKSNASRLLVLTAQVGAIGHFAPGVPNIGDFALTQPGYYGVPYNYDYTQAVAIRVGKP
jgi:hypothetical protein